MSNPLAWLDDWFAEYIEDRRREPAQDVLTDLALATYPDGTMPEVTAVVRTATFLFAAGQETTARLLAAALKYLAEHPELQDELRGQPDRIPNFIEEALRIESPVKADFRLARRTTTVGGVDIPAGTPVMLLNGAANRDPRRFECPAEFRVDRPNAQAHIAFGRGDHSCPGGPLARAGDGSASSASSTARATSGSPRSTTVRPARARFDYEPTWVLRGLTDLHLEFTPRAERADEPGRCQSPVGLRASGSASPDGSPPTVTAWPSSTRNGAAAEAAADELQAAGGHGSRRRRSTSPTGRRCAAAFDRVRSELGPVEILVTSAGIEAFDPLLDITAERWDRIIAVNLTGTFTCVQAAAARHDRRRLGTHRHHLLVERPVGRAEHGPLRGVEGRGHRADQGTGGRARPQGITVNTIAAEPGRHPDGPSRPKPPGTSPASTSSGRWSHSVGPARRPTSPRPARSCARTAAATSPARSSASTAACTSERR